ncbi:hypothetical protein ACGF5C_09735 [Micromonospora sp. NPDC047620]|uniref:hypothetical protein n=1 Tax=Micromonospora sp. NPDC047620 TaxID=3364251 RepID=UPI0037207E22
MSTDAIVLLKEDHKEMRRLFKAFQDAEEGPAAQRQKLVSQILEASRCTPTSTRGDRNV